MRTTKGLEMKLCRLFTRRHRSMLRATKRLALAAAVTGFASIAYAQSPAEHATGNRNASVQAGGSLHAASNTFQQNAGRASLRLPPVLSASALDRANLPANSVPRQCTDQTDCKVASNQPIALRQETNAPARMQDRHGMPIPMMVIGEPKAAASSMVTAANAQISGGAGQVSLAVASGATARGASPTQSQMQPSGESLIDIGIPIPGVPQPVPPSMPAPPSMTEERVDEQNLPSTGGIEASLNDVSVGRLPSDQISSRRVATQQQRGPQLVRRGEPMRISVESSSSQQGLLPAADDEGKIQVSFGDSPSSSNDPAISVDPGPSQDQVAHQVGIDPLSTTGTQSSAVDTVVTMNDSVMELSEMPTAQMEVPETEAMQLPAISPTGLATTGIPSQQSSRKLPPSGYRGEPTPAPLQLSALSAESSRMRPEPETFQGPDQEFTKLSGIASGPDGQDEQPKQLDVDVDPSQLSIGTEIVVSREKPLVFNMDSPVVDYSVEHPGICRLIQTSDKSLSLIGLQEGDTRIAVVTAGGQEDRNIEIRGVRVAGGERPLSRLQNLAREITQTIKRLYPYSDIQVVASSDELIVQGYVQLEKDARKILTLVRKTSLTPVVDRLHSMSR